MAGNDYFQTGNLCCKPFPDHPCRGKRDLRPISENCTVKWAAVAPGLKAGHKICRDCREHISNLLKPPTLDVPLPTVALQVTTPSESTVTPTCSNTEQRLCATSSTSNNLASGTAALGTPPPPTLTPHGGSPMMFSTPELRIPTLQRVNEEAGVELSQGGGSTSTESAQSSQDLYTPRLAEDKWCDSIFAVYSSLGLKPPTKDLLLGKQTAPRLLIELQKALKQSFINAAVVTKKFSEAPIEEENFDYQDVTYEMLSQIKEKLQGPISLQQKIHLISVLPQSWSTRFIAANFDVGRVLTARTKKLVAAQGILPHNGPRQNNQGLPIETVEKVKKFYLLPDISREMPGMRDVKSVKENGIRILKQKRLFLFNLREGYKHFQSENPDIKIGFSKFCELRPAEVVLAGAAGTHCVCVCLNHENVKLMISHAGLEDLSDVQDSDSSFAPSMKYRHCLARMKCSPPTIACHMQECRQCPGPESIREDLELVFNERMVEDVEYRQWTSTDRSSLEMKTQEYDDFIDTLLEKLPALSVHDYISMAQASFYQNRKENLKRNEVIIVGDFSQNYSFVIQDAVQGFHWNNSQCTVHPFAGYYRPADEDKLKPFNFVVLSDYLKHKTNAFYAFQKKLIAFIKVFMFHVDHIIYLSDGCKAQYKNRFNVSNLIHHQEDFGLTAEWHFFATSHGKGPSDGLGGTLKRTAASASLRKIGSQKISTPEELFEFSKQNLPNMNIEFVSTKEVEEATNFLEARFSKAAKIPNISNLHKIVPIDGSTIKVARDSSWSESYQIQIKEETKKRQSAKQKEPPSTKRTRQQKK